MLHEVCGVEGDDAALRDIIELVVNITKGVYAINAHRTKAPACLRALAACCRR